MKRDEDIRERAGRGSSVGGNPAKEALKALVGQFSQRSAFVRELVQNSLDAGAGRIELQIEQQARRLRIAVVDDGEGMDRATIEGYLLTLFRSNKERDLTKIGKFGIGFVSLFAVEPELVVVDTARDGVHHRVVFDSTYEYTLAQVDEPFEGTAVTLYVRSWGKNAGELAQELRKSLHYWCRYARADVSCWAKSGAKARWGWPEEEVDHPFTVRAPVTYLVEEDLLRAVVGFSGTNASSVGYYNRGLTLLEAREDVLPGVTFRVEAGELEHTLTRDNVRRDAAFRGVIAHLAKLASGPLLHNHLAAMKRLPPGDPSYGALLAALTCYTPLPTDQPLLRRANGGRVSMDDITGGMLARIAKRDLLYAPGPSRLVDALEAEGHPVLLKADAEMGWIQTHLPLRKRVDATKRYLFPQLVEQTELAQRADARAAVFSGGGVLLKDALCIRQSHPGTLEDRTERSGAGPLVVNIEHPLYKRCEALGAKAAPFLRTAMQRWVHE